MSRRLCIAAVSGCAGALLAASAWATPLALPPRTKVTLKNGLTVIVMPTHRLPLVDFRLVVRAGSVNDPDGKEGVASLTADLLTQGAGTRSARQVADDVAFVGGALESYAGTEQTVVTCEVLTKDLATGLGLFRDVIVSPSFPAEEFQRKKEESLGGLASQKSDPGTVADVSLLPLLFGKSPLGHPAQGWEKSVATITREDVVAYHARFVRPNNAILTVVGDVDPQTIAGELERAFSGWKASNESFADAYRAVPQGRGHKVVIVNKPEVTQTQIRLACMGVPRNHPDYYPIVVANTILGAAYTSRLVEEIRRNQGFTYSISSHFGMFRSAGTFLVTTFTRNETLRKTIDATLGVIRKLQDEGPSEDELAKSKGYLTGQFALSLQAPDDLAAQLANVEFYGLERDYLEGFNDRISAVTMTDCKRALKSYFCVDDLKILVVSDPETARKAMEGLGPIEVHDPL